VEINPGLDWEPVKLVHEVLDGGVNDCCRIRRAAMTCPMVSLGGHLRISIGVVGSRWTATLVN